ncbi:MAG: hypothetical protein J6O55_08330 [Lachnospiraceae bacterium]|nr:hypothetical protein [Lachnospiraceae bacterium]
MGEGDIKKKVLHSFLIVMITVSSMLLIGCLIKNMDAVLSFVKGNGGWFVFVQSMSTLLSLVSIVIIMQQYVSGHERARRETAVHMLFEWSKNLGRWATRFRKIAEKLSYEQSIQLYRGKRFKVNSEIYKDLKKAIEDMGDAKETKKYKKETGKNNAEANKNSISKKENNIDTESKNVSADKKEDEEKPQKSNKLYKLSKRDVYILRNEIIGYLNRAESILSAWQHNVADTQIIEDEFAFLLDESEGKTMLENFRKAAGSESSFPAIEMFCLHLRKKRESKLIRKKKLG